MKPLATMIPCLLAKELGAGKKSGNGLEQKRWPLRDRSGEKEGRRCPPQNKDHVDVGCEAAVDDPAAAFSDFGEANPRRDHLRGTAATRTMGNPAYVKPKFTFELVELSATLLTSVSKQKLVCPGTSGHSYFRPPGISATALLAKSNPPLFQK